MQTADPIFMRRELTKEVGCQAGQLRQLDLINHNEFKSETGMLATINLEQVAALEMLRALVFSTAGTSVSAGGQTPFCPGTG